MNGAQNETVPHSAPGDYRPPRMPFPPHEPGPSNGEPPPPPGQYVTTVPPHVPATPGPYDSSYYHSQIFGARQRKAARAQQVIVPIILGFKITSPLMFIEQACDQCRARKAKCDEGRPACSHCEENNLNCVYKEVPPHK
jgi:hypothetical protein